MQESAIKIIECPRDAMQGLKHIISTEHKIEYLNTLLRVGFDTIDFGSFVSAQAVPQLQDTENVLAHLNWEGSKTKLLCIIANERGLETAIKYPQITYVGYPFSLSETFQLKNTKKTIVESFELLKKIIAVCRANKKQPVIYLSMCFGNPYNDPWSIDIVDKFAEQIVYAGATIISLADTIGGARVNDIQQVFELLLKKYDWIEFGAHFHASQTKWRDKVGAAWDTGCRRFDSAIGGYGGCPFAQDELVGNIDTSNLLRFIQEQQLAVNIDPKMLARATELADNIFQGNESEI